MVKLAQVTPTLQITMTSTINIHVLYRGRGIGEYSNYKVLQIEPAEIAEASVFTYLTKYLVNYTTKY